MTSNSQEIIHDIRAELEKMINFVTGEQARTATADHIERGLFKLLIRLGAKLLTLFFVMRAQACSRDTLQTAEGHQLYYQRDTKRDYFSIFGKVALWRPYFYKTGVGGQTPLDAELSLGDDCYSDLVREVSEYLGVYSVYHKTTDILKRLLGLRLSTRVVEENIAEDAAAVEAYYAQKVPPAPTAEAEILVIQADGKGVPMILEAPAEPKTRLGKGEKRGHKKEAVVTTVYTITAAPRTPQAVVDSFFDQKQDAAAAKADSPHPAPQNKHVWATLDGKDAALARLAKQVALRQGSHIQHQVALCDGCEALQSRLANQFSDFTQVLDFIHADEYLWNVANSLLGETNEQRIPWMAEHTLQMLSGQTEQLIADFRCLSQAPATTSNQREQLIQAANYFERNLPYMDYPTYLARGWPIASGVIEGACRHFVKDRCELSGMRWNQDGAEHLLRLRAVAENDDWDTYHDFRKRQRHARLYRSPFPSQTALEFQAVDDVAIAKTATSGATDHRVATSQPVNVCRPKNYAELPLAV
jgi:hypothetical protein